MYCFYFYGLSFHVNKALIAHIVGYEMTWEMTKKEVENSNFFKEIPKIVNKFKYVSSPSSLPADGLRTNNNLDVPCHDSTRWWRDIHGVVCTTGMEDYNTCGDRTNGSDDCVSLQLTFRPQSAYC